MKCPSWKICLYIVLLSFTLVIQPVSATSELTLHPTDDTYVEDWKAGDKFGKEDHLSVANGKNEFRAYTKVIFLRFDLSGIPEGVTIKNATLRLKTTAYVIFYETPKRMEVGVRFCDRYDWDEEKLCWNNQPSYEHTPESTSIITISTKKYYEWTVTECVKKTLEHNAVTLVLKDENPERNTRSVSFYSKEAKYEDWWPKLIIEYSTGTEQTSNNGSGIPGFPLEGIVTGLVLGVAVVLMKRYRSARK